MPERKIKAMNYKLLLSYIFASVLMSLVATVLTPLVSTLIDGLSLRTDWMGFLRMTAISALGGLVIGLAIQLFDNKYRKIWIELPVCVLSCLVFANLLTIGFESSLEGTWVWFSAIGAIYGLLLFLIKTISVFIIRQI
jgi:hypothetical protein